MIKDIERLEKVQRRATRMIEECKGISYEERLQATGLTSLETRRSRADMLEVFKILRGFEGVDERVFFNRFTERIGVNTRGHSLKLVKERFNKDVMKYSFSNRVINMWNRLPENVVNCTSINSFKTNVDKIIRKKWGISMS